ncbi:TRAP transporter small permease [Paracoccus spongiarum]|uniref:TRAP transporter small permease protein n=1 Tax=Paracoccus spongiarum TaxID=3064387 RepID=A0ABT9JCA5_9RHOB|nr:TRAP transporter small permease subunit [Paracoccus sp. 2205BS29-5]MDP5307436.1 TRAP transporter small permease subunit [Paracoccus sp. 2205BS29-5]
MDRMTRIAGWLHRRAENVAALMLAVMFAAFIVQIASRYVFNLPVGGANELTITMWLWVVLWGAAFVLRERDEIRFDIVYGSVGPGARRVMTLIASAALVALYGYSLPAVWDYVTFMKIQKTSYLDIRYDWLFSIYVIFAVAVLIRYAWLFVGALAGRRTGEIQRGDGQT